MLLQALTSTPTFPDFHTHYHRQNSLLLCWRVALNVSRLNGVMRTPLSERSNGGMAISASNLERSNLNVEKKRKVVEHVCLLKAKQNLSEEDENDMLDYLYTSQYQMRGIVAISLGRISNSTVENYTHAVVMRFQRKEDVEKFYENPFYLRVLKEHVMPYCHGLINVDYESEVEDDILSIFRKGEEFNYGVEFVHLMTFNDSAFGAPIEDALVSLEKLTKEFPSLIIQSTHGSNFNCGSQEYTHGIVTRFRSLEAYEMFVGSKEYKDTWKTKFELIVKKTLPVHFSVDPVGKEIM